MAGGDNADKFIFRQNSGIFSKGSSEKVSWSPSLLKLFFMVVPFQSTHSCVSFQSTHSYGCEWWVAAGIFLQSDKLKGALLIFVRKNSGWGILAIRWLACIGPDRF